MVAGGGLLNQSTAVATPDGKFIVVAAAASVQLRSSVTGETVHTMTGHTQDVTALVLDPSDETKVTFDSECLGCASSGLHGS